MAKSKKKIDVHQIITGKIIALLEKGVVPWNRSWWTANPRNLVSGKQYRGINVFLLACSEFKSPYWLTWKQAEDTGGRVKDSEAKNSEQIVFWKMFVKNDTDAAGNEIKKHIPMLRYFRVYNLDQCEGIEAPAEQTKLDFHPIEVAENIVDGYQDCPVINHGGDQASFSLFTDKITMPDQERFDNGELYYSTLFHEMIHSTGTKSRTGRFGTTDSNVIFDKNSYSNEELIAECGAAMLSADAGIESVTIENSVAYIGHWLKRLKNDHKLIISAAGKAQKAVDHVLGRSWNNDGDTDKDRTETKLAQSV